MKTVLTRYMTFCVRHVLFCVKKILPRVIYEALKHNILYLMYPYISKNFLYRLTSYESEKRLDVTGKNIDAQKEIVRQIELNYEDVMNKKHISRQSKYLLDKIPRDRTSILDLGCGAGHAAYHIASRFSHARIIGLDASGDFIQKTRDLFAIDQVSFLQGDMHAMQFENEQFDCVVADNVLEHSYDIDTLLSEIGRVLCEGGLLIAAVPSDGRNAMYDSPAHLWKAVPQKVFSTLEGNGFRDISIEEINTVMRFASPLYPPSNDMMMYITARKFL